MRITVALSIAAAAALSTGCVGAQDQAALLIVGAQSLEPPDCDVNPRGQQFRTSGQLDIGAGLTDANAYTNVLTVVSTLPPSTTGASPNYPNYGGAAEPNIIFLERAEVFFETDVARRLEGAATPGGGAKPRKSAIGGVLPPGGDAIAIVNTITEDDARSLQQEPLVTEAGLNPANPERSVRIIARISVEGKTLSNTFVKSPFFSYPIDLCVGCLTQRINAADCPEGTALEVNEVCNLGQDIPLTECN